MTRAEFAERFGYPDVREALCGYTREDDSRVALTLLVHANPRRVLEVGTALGHMTANLTRWTAGDARVFTIDLVRGMSRAAPGAVEQQVEVPSHEDWGRFNNHFGTAHKAFFITADTMRYEFGRIAPLDFAFIDGAHALEHVLNDSGKVYEPLAPGGWLVWHDFTARCRGSRCARRSRGRISPRWWCIWRGRRSPFCGVTEARGGRPWYGASQRNRRQRAHPQPVHLKTNR